MMGSAEGSHQLAKLKISKLNINDRDIVVKTRGILTNIIDSITRGKIEYHRDNTIGPYYYLSR